jgi:hypothetical protein
MAGFSAIIAPQTSITYITMHQLTVLLHASAPLFFQTNLRNCFHLAGGETDPPKNWQHRFRKVRLRLRHFRLKIGIELVAGTNFEVSVGLPTHRSVSL